MLRELGHCGLHAMALRVANSDLSSPKARLDFGVNRTFSRCLLWSFLGCAIPCAAGAAEPTKTEIAVARAHFDDAVRAENEGRWRDAVEHLEKAITIKETAGLRYHLGFAKENIGSLVDAMLEYQRAAGLIHSGVTTEEIERFIAPKLEEMKKRVPRLTVQVPPDVNDAELRIDGVPVKRELLGTPLPLNPGTHALVVFAPGRRPFHVQVSLGEGTAVSQAAELVPETVSPVGPIPPGGSPNTRSSSSEGPDAPGAAPNTARTWTLIAEGAVAVGGLAVGVGYLLSSSAAQRRLDDANARLDLVGGSCRMPTPAFQADCATLATVDSNRDRNVAIGGFIVAGLGAAGLGTTLVLWKTSHASALSVRPNLARNQRGFELLLRY